MNRQDPNIRTLLAAEYVIGTLTGPARRRFQRLLLGDAVLRAEVVAWEQRLMEVMRTRAPLPTLPPAKVWQRIQAQLPRPAQQPRRSLKRRAWVAAAAVAILAIVVVYRPPVDVDDPAVPVLLVEHVAELAMPDDSGRWRIGVRADEVVVAAVAAVTLDTSADYELWWVGDGAPVSLGVLPRSGEVAHSLPEGVPPLDVGALAVSLEAAGGSVTGAPAEVMLVHPIES
jgi:anti-sigma-K factor RskA